MSISIPNMAPAAGVPNTPPNPAVTPLRSSVCRVDAESGSKPQAAEAMPAPICTAVPSRPAEPPKRWVISVLEKIMGAILRGTAPADLMAVITRSFPPLVERPKCV